MTAVATIHTPSADAPLALVPQQRLGLLRPLAAPAEVLQSQEEARALVQETLKEGRDYGKIPGVDKPSLLKPGAERLNLAFGCSARFRLITSEVEHDRPVPWRKTKAIYEGPKGNRRKTGEEVTEGASVGLYRYVFECEIVHRESGHVVASCIASCSSMESKYIDRPRDSENTIIKMAEKRALVGATLLAYGLSEQFTQDVEDLPREVVAGDAAADDDAVKCPTCKGAMWDNRATNDEREKQGKKRMPDYKCRDKGCEAVIWDAAKYADQLELDSRPAKAEAGATATTAAAATSTADTPPAASPYQVKKILELCDHTAIEESLAEKTRARVKAGVTSAFADRILVGLETAIKKATPKPVPAKPAAEPSVQELQAAADSAAIHELTQRYKELIASDRIAPNVQDRVRQRMAKSELTVDVLRAAIVELEDAEIPF